MNFISETSLISPFRENIQKPKNSIQLQIDPDICAPEVIVNKLASIEGPIDIYCWYEGPQYLPRSGASFMTESIFKPLYEQKASAKLYLYSLKAWNFTRKVANMPSSTPIGEAINLVNKAAIECIYSSSFFQYCADIQNKNGIYEFLKQALPEKQSLFALSKNYKKKGMTIDELFNKKPSVFDGIKDLDISEAYSFMQGFEGYYLIQESIKKALLNEEKKIQIAFVLPNDESKYYLDYTEDIKKMLQIDFGDALSDVDINISFQFFEYEDSLTARPYINKNPKAIRVKPIEIRSYFNYLA